MKPVLKVFHRRSLREQSQQHPLPTSLKLHGAVHTQAFHGCLANGSKPDHGSRFLIHFEVLFPTIFPRMKQKHFFIAWWHQAFEVIGFVDIASSAGQSQVPILLSPTARSRDYMFHLEREVKKSFRGMTILTPMASSTCHKRVMKIQVAKPFNKALARSPAARTSASTKASNSACSSGERKVCVSRA